MLRTKAVSANVDLLGLFLLRMVFLLCCVVYVLPLILSDEGREHVRTEPVFHSSPGFSTEPRFREAETMGRASFANPKGVQLLLSICRRETQVWRCYETGQSIAVSQLGTFVDKQQDTTLAYLTKKEGYWDRERMGIWKPKSEKDGSQDRCKDMVAGTIQPPPLGVTSLQHSFPSLPLLCSRWPKESVLDQPSSVSYVHHLERVNKTQSLRLRISSSLHAVGKGYSLKGKWSAVRKREWVLGGYKIPMSTPESKVQAHEHWLPKYALFLSLGQHGISSVHSQW